MDSRYYAIALSNIDGVGSVTFRKLVKSFGSPERVFSVSLKELSEIKGLRRDVAEKISSFHGWETVENEIKKIERARAGVLTITDAEYPERLKEIYDAPPVLYMKGYLSPDDKNALAIVGSRNATTYGTISTEGITKGLSEHGITIVSGMARGIDSLAHQSALKAGGRTIAVLGSGVDIIYPPENKKLYHSIIENGCVLSEYPVGAQPEAPNFPRRNRIISGLSLGVIVIEASESSGALITARLALEQNREVFAVPGNITSLRSRGTNQLIREGAKLVENADDIIEELKNILMSKPPGKNFGKENIHKNLENLTVEEKNILDCLCNEPVYIDTVIDKSGFSSEKALGILLELELRGLIRQMPGKNFILQM